MKRKDYKKHLAKIYLISVCFILVAFSLIGCSSSKTQASDQIISIADDAVALLKEQLKEPASLYINKVMVSEFVSNGSTIGLNVNTKNENDNEAFTYTVYIDYMANTAINKEAKSCFKVTYCLIDGEKKLIDFNEIKNIPELSGTVYEIDKIKLHSYSDTMK